MKFVLAVAVLTVVGAHAASDIVVKVDQEELSPLLRLILLKYLHVWSILITLLSLAYSVYPIDETLISRLILITHGMMIN